VHLDVDALRQSAVVQKAYKSARTASGSAKHLDKVRDLLGMDPRKPARVMAYGKDTDKQHGVFSSMRRESEAPAGKGREGARP